MFFEVAYLLTRYRQFVPIRIAISLLKGLKMPVHLGYLLFVKFLNMGTAIHHFHQVMHLLRLVTFRRFNQT